MSGAAVYADFNPHQLRISGGSFRSSRASTVCASSMAALAARLQLLPYLSLSMKLIRHFPVSTATLSLIVSVTLAPPFRTSSWGSRLTLTRLHSPSPACLPPVLRALLSLFATILVHALLTAAAASPPPSLTSLPLQQLRWMPDPALLYFAALMVLVDLVLVGNLLGSIAVRSSGALAFPVFGKPPPMTSPGS